MDGSNANLECVIKGKEEEKWTQAGYRCTGWDCFVWIDHYCAFGHSGFAALSHV